MSFVTNPSRRKLVFAIIAVGLIGLGTLTIWLIQTNPPEHWMKQKPITIKRSEMQGDYIRDERTAEEACNPLLSEAKNSNPNLNCRLTDSKRIDDYLPDECVDGISVGGCFACTFECR